MKALLVLVVTVLTFSTATAQSAEELLQQALTLERSQGDYSGAIALYQQVSAAPGTDRRLTGKALIQIARAYENMGRSEAARTYQQVLADFGDMPELAAEAREGYARTRTPVPSTPVPGSRTTFEFPEEWNDSGASLSPSGRYLLAALGGYEYGLGILEIETGARRTVKLDIDGRPRWARYSPDESEIATGWQTGSIAGVGSGSVIKIDAASGAHTKLFDAAAYWQSEVEFQDASTTAIVMDWSQDGSHILAWVTVSEAGLVSRTEEFVLIHADSGEVERVPESRITWQSQGTYSRHWDQGCLSPDGRFVFADYQTFDGQSQSGTRFVRRFDMETGAATDFRTSRSGDVSLWTCTWDPEYGVIYSVAFGGTTNLYEATITDLSGTSDRLLTSIPEETYTFAGSKRADLPMLDDWGLSMFELDIDPVTGSLAGPPSALPDAAFCGARWNLNGSRAAWAQGQSFVHSAVVIDADSGQTRIIDAGTNRRVSGCFIQWVSDDILAIGVRNERGAPLDFLWYDVATGEKVDEVLHTEFGELELVNAFTVLPDGRLTAWDSESRCVVALERTSGNTETILCDQLSGFQDVGVNLTPDGQHLFVAGFPDSGPAEYALSDLDGGNYRVFAQRDPGCQVSWAGPELLSSACGPRSNRDRLQTLNTQTGEVVPYLTKLTDMLAVRYLHVSPRGNKAIVLGIPRALWDAPAVVTVLNRATGGDR